MARQKVAGWATPYTFTGKEKDDLTGLQYFGARYYDSRISIWYGVDPMAEKYPQYTPFNYTLDNPIRLVDPDGMEVDDVIISGPQADKAVQELNKSSSLKITRNQQTGQISASGKPSNKADKKLLEAINDKKITVELRTTDKQLIDSKDGTKDVPLIPAAYEGSTVNEDQKVNALQIINVDNAVKISELLGETPAATITHEINESFFGAKRDPGGNYSSGYDKAHKSAARIDKLGLNHGNLDLNFDSKRNIMQVRKSGAKLWIDLGILSK